MNTKTATALIVTLTCAALVGCSAQMQSQDPARNETPDVSAGVEANRGLLEIFLTDAPPGLNIEKVMVTISDVQAHRAAEGEAADEETQAGWFTVVETPQTFDLIALRDAKTLLGSAELEPGKYTQIRLSIADAAATIDGAEETLKVPSGTIKLVHPFTIEAGQVTELVLDFDAEESIHAAGKKYMMRPTIKVIVEGPTPE